MTQWNRILVIKDAANKQIENIRQTGAIGSSLDAEIKLYCDESNYQLLEQLGTELKFLFITSNAELYPAAQTLDDAVQATNHIGISISPSRHKQCPRCWHRCEDIKASDYGMICARCLLNIDGEGEKRIYL